MIVSSLYNNALELIERHHPDLVLETTSDDIDKEKLKFYTLGNFAEVREKDRRVGDNQYYIIMKIDHPQAEDEDKLVSSLFHEYGHFLCRTAIYPKLGLLGKFVMRKLQSRIPFKKSKDFATNFIVVIEELVAWIISWGYLGKLHSLKINHISYGLKCWRTYLPLVLRAKIRG